MSIQQKTKNNIEDISTTAAASSFSSKELCDHFQSIKESDFPALTSSFQNKTEPKYIYLDSAATSLKPMPVIHKMAHFYLYDYATVHRAIYSSAVKATELYNHTRQLIAEFICAQSDKEIIFTRGTTDSVNIVADALCHDSAILNSKKTILVSAMEHHSNLVPWQMACQKSGASIRIVPLCGDHLDLDALDQLLRENDVALFAVTHTSNILGTVNPILKIATLCHQYNALLFVDGAQSVPHFAVDMTHLQCDFFAFSSHKISGPTGVGVLWAKQELLDKMTPSRGGGDMIDLVRYTTSTYATSPLKFEPGTPSIAEVIGMGFAVEYLQNRCGGMEKISQWERSITEYLCQQLLLIGERVVLFGTSQHLRGSLQSFTVQDAHPLDVATLLDIEGIAIRSGHLCGQPLLASRGQTSILRASVAYYNSHNDIDIFIHALKKVLKKI